MHDCARQLHASHLCLVLHHCVNPPSRAFQTYSAGVQAANYFRNDRSWDPLTPPGHSVYTWTGHQDAAPLNPAVYIPLQIRAYTASLALAASADAAPVRRLVPFSFLLS
jgi:hypothetical protein